MNTATRMPSRRAIDLLVGAGLQARREGWVRDWVGTRHPRLSAWLDLHWLNLVLGTLGDAVPLAQRRAVAQRELLVWAMSQLRPDRQPGLSALPPHAWLQSTSWRPLLALACHHGMLAVPDFPSHYRRRPDESAIDNLCGLWSVVPSTFYRYLDKGRHQLVSVFEIAEPSGELLLSLRDAAWQGAQATHPLSGDAAGWHRMQAAAATTEGRAADALWHCWQAQDVERALMLLQRHAVALAATQESDVILAAWQAQRRDRQLNFELALLVATLWRHRHDEHRENEQLQLALRLAQEAGSELMHGRAYAALGRLHETRDPDRSFACYDDSVRHLNLASNLGDEAQRRQATAEFVRVLLHLAWLHLRRNDPKSLPLLEQVDRLARQHPLAEELAAEVEQVWGEYWRCKGDLQRALAHKQRALNIFERLGDLRSVLATCSNLCLIYGEVRNHERALHHGQRVLNAASQAGLDPDLVGGANMHIGISHFYQGQLDQAIAHYQRARQIYEAGGVGRPLADCHYNLAEAYFHRFAQCKDPEDERLGDHHAGVAVRMSTDDNRKSWAAAASGLKGSILADQPPPDRLIPEEYAEHYDEMTEVQRLRQSLAAPHLTPQAQVNARLAIARAYLAISTREREQALALAAKHGLPVGELQEQLTALRQTFDRALSREESTRAAWVERSSDLLAADAMERVLQRLFRTGSVNKSAYAELSGLGLATASKHLGILAERGLLVQTGKGPATRYLLPEG